MALHLAFFVKFMENLDGKATSSLEYDIEQEKSISLLQRKWGKDFEEFIKHGSTKNATFSLHKDIMHHCDEIVAISAAERIGGADGYNLLLAAVKSSLPFSFLNGASSYAAFCVDLLNEHYSAGKFHKNLKMALFSTQYKDGHVNMALDTQREMDHKDAIKGFRPRSTIQSVIPRMTIVDRFTDTHKVRKMVGYDPDNTVANASLRSVTRQHFEAKCQHVQFSLDKKDTKYIIPVARLILQVGALSSEESKTPKNIYDPKQISLPESILDEKTYSVGKFLIKKYAASQELFGLSKKDCQDVTLVEGPKQILRKVKSSKGTTMRRISSQRKPVLKPDNEIEKRRQAEVKRKTKIFDCMSSEMNTCQSIVNPDCSKATVQKSQGIKKALLKALSETLGVCKPEEINERLEEEKLVFTAYTEIPNDIKKEVKFVTMEFAGVKFKTKATSGEQYLKQVENGVIKKVFRDFPNVQSIIVCEEKYNFTPDDLKAATRIKRQKSGSMSIAHLKTGEDIISDRKLSKSAVVHTGEGKRMISNYLARNVHTLDVKNNVSIYVDSELIMSDCKCSANCLCPKVAFPIKAKFDKNGFVSQTVLENICQRKGEAEMAQVDWLGTILPELGPHESVVSVVTSGDIDSLVIHLFALSIHWPRNPDDSFKNKVFIQLQKLKPDIYNITGIIERLEQHWDFKYAALHIAVVCCMGGNDFIPKFHGISHEKWMVEVLQMPSALQSIVKYEILEETMKPFKSSINKDVFIETVKRLYCPKQINVNHLTLEETRQLSIKQPGKDYRHPTAWMPPVSALYRIVSLLNCQLAYLHTVWSHSAILPDFLGNSCLKKDDKGTIKYDFGPDCKVGTLDSLLSVSEEELRQKVIRSKKCLKRDLSFSDTPSKERKWKKKALDVNSKENENNAAIRQRWG